MKIILSKKAKKHLNHWKRSNPRIVKKIGELVADIALHLESGLGKPEPLKHQYSGYWSRMIDKKNRLIYRCYHNEAEELVCEIVQMRFHYDDK